MDVIYKCIRAKCTVAAGVRTRGRGGLEGRLERKPGGEEEAGGRCGTTGQLSSGQWARGQCEENKDRNKIETAGPPGTADAGPADAGPAAERESRPAEPPGLTVPLRGAFLQFRQRPAVALKARWWRPWILWGGIE